MSTETRMSAPTHAPAQTRRPGLPPVPAARVDTGALSWNRPTSDGIPAVEQTQPPRMRQLMGVCGWAAVLGGLGLVIGIRGFIGDLMGFAPGWYEPAMIMTGAVGIGLTVGAFVMVHRRRLPYALLGASTAVLLIALILTVNAF